MIVWVAPYVVLTNHIGDGQDYRSGEPIVLNEDIAKDWERRGWIVATMPKSVTPKKEEKIEGYDGR